MRYLSLVVVLALFWVLLSGYFTALMLSLGSAAVALVVWFVWRMNRIDEQPVGLRPGFGLLRYGVWLAWKVILSNIDVARRIWSPGLPVRPVWGGLEVGLRTPLQKSLYANSITLTPGTLTADVRPGHFLIHALTDEGLNELRDGEMERRILGSWV